MKTILKKYNRIIETGDHFKSGGSPKSLMSRDYIMQRAIILFAFFYVSVASIFAQDVITLKNGDEIQAIVQEIGEVDIKYKKYDNPNGPNYTLKKSDIFMIRYANGSKDVFTDNDVSVNVAPVPVTVQASFQSNAEEVYINFWGTMKYRPSNKKVTSVEDLFYNLPEAFNYYRSGIAWNLVGGVITCVGGCIMAWDTFKDWDDSNHDSFNCGIFWTGMGVFLVGTIISSVGGSKIKTSVDLYNASVRRQYTSDISLNLGITRTGGIGVTLNF